MIVAAVVFTAAMIDALPLAAAQIQLEREMGPRAVAWQPEFRGKNLEAQSTLAPEWVLSGPFGTGKTFAGLNRLDLDARRFPHSRWSIIRKVRAALHGTVLETWHAIIERRGGVTRFGGHTPTSYLYENGAEVFVGGLDNPGKTLGGERDGVYVPQLEELELGDYETLITRTTGRGARGGSVNPYPYVGGDCNPGADTHWIKHRDRLLVLDTYHRDNPRLFHSDGTPTEAWTKQEQPALESLTGVRRERGYYGRWVASEGVVFEDFDRNVHVIPRFKIPGEWRRFGAIDFGFKNPFVWQLWALSPDGVLYLDREIYRTKTLVSDHAKVIRSLTAGMRIEATVADHDAEDRATLDAEGIPTIAANKAVQPGLEAVHLRLRHNLQADPPIKPRLYIFDDALDGGRDEDLAREFKPTCTAQEFAVYSYAKNAAGRPLKDEPLKRDDHGVDATRYLARYIELSERSGGVEYAGGRRHVTVGV